MVIEVLVELSAFNIDKTFYYKVPENLIDKIQIGVRVLVPFSHQTLEGFVMGFCAEEIDNDVKEIIDVIDQEVILNDELLELGKYVSEKTISTLISSYQVMLPKALKAKKKKDVSIKYVTYVKIKNLDNYQLTSKQEEIVSLLKEQGQVLYPELKKINSSVDTLIKNNVLEKFQVEKYRLEIDTVTKEEKKVFSSALHSSSIIPPKTFVLAPK